MKRRVSFATGFLMVVLGCGGGLTYYPATTSTAPQRSEPCYLQGPSTFNHRLIVHELDGQEVRYGSKAEDTWIAEINPGTHTMRITGFAIPPDIGLEESDTISLTMDCEPGHIYIVRPPSFLYLLTGGHKSLDSWSPEVADVTNTELGQERILPRIRAHKAGGGAGSEG